MWLGPILLAACESEAEIAEAMERGLRSANEALVPVLFTAETLFTVVEPVDVPVARHGTACGTCPCASRNGLPTGPHLLTLDYEEGCLPSSGLLPTLLAGHSDVLWTGTEASATWTELTFRLEEPVTGTLGGPIALDGQARLIGATGDFAIGAQDYDLAVDLVLDVLGAAADGEVTVAGARFGTVVLDGVALSTAGIALACPTPDLGTATLLDPEDPDHDVVVDFAKPGGGRVTVTRDDRVSEAVDLCAYASDRL